MITMRPASRYEPIELVATPISISISVPFCKREGTYEMLNAVNEVMSPAKRNCGVSENRKDIIKETEVESSTL